MTRKTIFKRGALLQRAVLSPAAGAAKLILLAVMILCVLAGCGSKDEEKKGGINAYLLGEESVPALQVEENVEFTSTEPDTYAYIGLENAGSTAEKYVASMTAEENGFSVVDKRYASAEAPDFTKESGEVYLSKKAASEEGKLIVVGLNWASGVCTLELSMQEPPKGQTASKSEGLTHLDAATKIEGMKPSVLGLEGDSMKAYHVYIQNGLVIVEDEECIWVEVYTSNTAAGTNAPAGTYYLSRDGQRMYALNRDDNSVTALKIS